MFPVRVSLVALACLSACGASEHELACTAFHAGNPDSVLTGKSFDWKSGDGLLLVNPRGALKRGLVSDAKPHEWVSRWGSVSFVMDGKDHAVGGMNEAGLVVEVLFLSSALFPPPRASEPALNELQWVQFALDSFSTVAEVEASLGAVSIEHAFANIHYFACDASARCLTIDPVNGAFEVARLGPESHQVLTNDTHANAETRIRVFEGFGGTRRIPEPGTLAASAPTARYARMSLRLESSPVASVAAAFGALDAVRNVNPEIPTQWQIVYDHSRSTLWFKDSGAHGTSAAATSISLKELDFSCHTHSRAFGLDSLQEEAPAFPFDAAAAKLLLENAPEPGPAAAAFRKRISETSPRNSCELPRVQNSEQAPAPLRKERFSETEAARGGPLRTPHP